MFKILLEPSTFFMISVPTNSESTFSFDWRKDLECARNLTKSEKAGFELLLAWFETWRVARQLPPNRDSARDFWKAQVISKVREQWKLDQWSAAIRWCYNPRFALGRKAPDLGVASYADRSRKRE